MASFYGLNPDSIPDGIQYGCFLEGNFFRWAANNPPLSATWASRATRTGHSCRDRSAIRVVRRCWWLSLALFVGFCFAICLGTARVLCGSLVAIRELPAAL